MRKNRLFIVVILISLLLFLISCGNREVSVKFNSNGGTTIETKFVAQGTIVDEPDISKEGYSFGGWFEEESFIESSLFDFTRPVNRNIVLYAKWNINSYTINFHHNNDDEDTVLTINFNDTINYPVIEKENYVFQGWYISSNFNGNPYDKEKMPASNLNLYAKWEIKTYEVTFLNGEQVVKRVTVNHGDDLLENDIPNPPKVTGKVTYWDLDVDLTNITKNIEVNLKMDDKYYLVTISDSDNNIYLSEEVKHGESFIVPTSFEKVGYQFEGYLHYLPNEELIITNDLEIIVSFIPIVYQVIFRDQDDVVIDTRNVNHGNKVSEPNINIPEHYEKDGWYEENSLINFTFDTPITSNLTLKLKVTAKEYQMIFNGNGGVFSSNEETNIIKKTYNEIVGIPEAPTKEGFSFSGWYDNPELTGNIVSFSPQTRMSGNVTYYAKWSAKTYQITYNNVIDIEHRNPKTYNINTNDITLSNPFEREGYTFNGWYKEDDFVTKVTTIEKGSFGDITLYGKWDINQYTITFNTNGGNEIAPLVLNYEEEIIKPVDPIRLGYTFNGWNKVIPSNMPAENLSFTANWTIINYQITYHLDGGNHSNNPLTYNVLTNTIVLNEGTKEGYTFIGWFDEVALGSLIVEINKGTIGDIELYARYEINKYTVTFLDYDDTELKVEENVSWNTDATAPSDPIRTGYSFTGWDILFINVKEDLTVKAIYQVNTYDITYNLDDGINDPSNPSKYTIETETITLEPVNKEGYNFVGWYDAEIEGTKVTTITKGSTGNVELYARFEINTFEVTFKDYNGDVLKSETVNWNEPASAPDDPSRTGYSFTGWDEEFSNVKDDLVVTAQYDINQYTITFNTNDGTSISPITQDYDTLVTAPDNPTKLGYTFDGWNKGIPSNMPAEDITITASWKVVEYDITYNLDDGINDPSNPSKYTIETETITLEPANKEGYTFVGWYDAETGGIQVTTITKGSIGNKELYARFEINTFEVTFKDHDGSILKVQENVPWNTGATAPSDPSRLGYTFSGWDVDFSNVKSDLTVTAQYTINEYTITFDTNGGTSISPITQDYDTLVTAPDNPTKLGYTFNGWDVEVPTTMPAEDITITASWIAHTYTVTYNGNGSDLGTITEMSYHTYNVSARLTLNEFTKMGYSFVHWNTSDDGTGISYNDNQNVINLTSVDNDNIVLYAIWSAYPIITFNSSGGSEVTSISKEAGDDIERPNNPTKEGYTFVNWYLDMELENVFVFDKMPTEDTVLYAKWDVNQYTITFDTNGGTSISPIKQDYDTSVTAPDNPTKLGYTFNGWDVEVPTTMPAEDITITASWKVVEYDITYNLDDGINDPSNPSKYTIETETITLEPANKEGYTFVGWYDAETGGIQVTTITKGSIGNKELYARFEIKKYTVTFIDYDETELKVQGNVPWNTGATAPSDPSRLGYSFTGWDVDFSNVKSDLTVTAQYTINEYTITFDTNGGTSISPIKQDYDTSVTAPDNPTKLGYTFDGWDVEVPTTMPAQDITITASWQVVEYDITYNLDDGINDPSNPSKYTIETEIITLEPANKEGYTFVGWYDLEVEGTKVITIINGSTGNVELYARFEINTFEVTFKDHDGSILKVQENVPWNTGATAPINPTRLGYSFTGWDVDFSNVKSDLTVTAQYTINEYTITFDTNGGTSISPIKQDYDTSVTAPDNPTKLGYTFNGWDVEVPTTMPAEDITITASWKVVEYDMTYHLDDGTNNPSNPSEYTIETETITLLPASKDGYSFVGWYDAETEGLQVTTITKGSIGNKELYARFEIKKYTVTFIDYDETELKVQGNVPWNTGATAPSDPSRLGYSFTGWDEDFTNVKDDLVVTALYSINYYTITYEGLDSIASNNPSTYTILDRIIFNDPENKLGYAFIGWYDDLEDGELVLGINKGSYGNITLYAYFEESFSYYDVNINYLFVEYTDLDINHGTGDETKTLSDTYMESNILHGSEFSPVVSMDGYIFYKYEIIDDNNEYGFNDLITIDKAGIEINVYYRKIINEIVFIQRGATWPTNPFDYDQIYKYLQYGEDLDSSEIPELTDYDGETVIWDREVFNDIKQNITVSALYFSNSSKTIRFIDGNRTVLIISQGELLDTDTFITSESPIWKMTKSGYHFEGWFIDDVLFVIGDYTFDQITGNQIVITTKWTELKKYNTSTNMDFIINEEDDEYEFIIKWELDLVVKGEQLEEPLFELYLDNNLVGQFEVIKSDGKYILTIDTNHEKYETLLALTEVGTHVIEIRALGNGETTTNSNKSRFEYIRKSIFDEDPDQVDVYDYFIIEEFRGVKRYILYTNMVYQFSNTSVVDVISGIDLFDTAPNNYTLKTNNIPGSFRFKITKDGEFIIYEGLIVKDIKQFTYGSSYQQYIDVEDINKTSYLVGNQNDFYFDLRMRNTKGEQIRINDVELEYEVSILDGTENPLEEGDFNTYFTFEPNNRIRFTSEAINKTFKFKVASKYQANKMTLGGLEYIITVNDGYNAFTNQDLKDLYGNLDVDLINIHANIKAELAPSQLNTDGSPKNTKNGLGNVYNRNNTSNNDDQITIEGNYMLIDGSDLPYSNINSGGGEVGFGSAFPIVNVQIAIFNYNMGTYKIENEIPTYNNSKLTMNNLMIVGNTRTPSVNYASSIEEILYQEGLMSKNSGGFIGVMVNNGSSEFNNVEVKYGVIGFSNYAYGLASENNEIEMKLNEVFVSDSWANGVYMQGATLLTVNDSYLGKSGGPAFHVSDIRKEDGINNPTIVINNTVVDNYVSGQEAWFKAYNMSSIALGMKQMIESGIEDTGRSIINELQDPVTKIETEMINLVLLTEPKAEAIQKDGEDNVESASEVVVIIDGITLYRPFNYLSDYPDPRIMGDNFVFPIGEYSDLLYGFQDLIDGIIQIATLYQIPLDQGQISNIASLAAFYNLTAEQVMGTLNQDGSINTLLLMQVVGTNMVNGIYPPEYLEVLHKADIFSLAGVTEGYSVIIIGLEA